MYSILCLQKHTCNTKARKLRCSSIFSLNFNCMTCIYIGYILLYFDIRLLLSVTKSFGVVIYVAVIRKLKVNWIHDVRRRNYALLLLTIHTKKNIGYFAFCICCLFLLFAHPVHCAMNH